MLSLPEQMQELSEKERDEVEDFACEAAAGLLGGQFPREAYEAVGFSKAEIDDIKQMRYTIAQKNEYVFFRKYFKKDFHASLWNNLARCGLMSNRAMEKLGAMGVSAPQQAAA